MRTTVTLDPDVELIVKRRMAQHGVGFKQALNDTICENGAPVAPFKQRTSNLGSDLDAVELQHRVEQEDLERQLAIIRGEQP